MEGGNAGGSALSAAACSICFGVQRVRVQRFGAAWCPGVVADKGCHSMWAEPGRHPGAFWGILGWGPTVYMPYRGVRGPGQSKSVRGKRSV